MKVNGFLIAILYLLFSVSGSLYCIGEKTVRLDGGSIVKMADVRNGIAELRMVRPGMVLALSSSGTSTGGAAVNTGIAGRQAAPSLDMSVSFDEGHPSLYKDSTGRYKLTASSSLAAVDRPYARAGYGAALFPGVTPVGIKAGGSNGGSGSSVKTNTVDPLVIEAQSTAALFAPNNCFGDFSLEFWLHPLNFENGEQILLWISVLPSRNTPSDTAGTNYTFQRIVCTSSKNRLQWSFQNFFTSPDRKNYIDINLTGLSTIVPKTWSHHLIRFDSATGMVEYLINGNSESIEYATSTRREGGEVYSPVSGEGGSFVLGGNYMGLMDEFKVYGSYLSVPALKKYTSRGGRIETRAIDLGEGNNDIIKVEASGGRTSILQARINSEYRQNGRFLFSDDSEMQFFIRSSDNPYRWDDPWLPVIPGTELEGAVHGRYVQLAVDFYPSADGEVSPYLEEIKITYFPEEPPLPPPGLTAVAMDGVVQLTWKSSPNPNVQGYLVYYGTENDDGIYGSVYFGDDATFGASPVDVGKTNTIRIDGLKNGTLYYFRVAAYSGRSFNTVLSQAMRFNIGEFSREVRARPLQGLSATLNAPTTVRR